MCAPMEFSGSIMRAIGLEFKDSSPESIVEKDCPARIPEISRVVVPLFPVFSVSAGFFSPWSPFPRIRIRAGVWLISIPKFLKHCMVARQSAPCRKLVISVVPLAMEPNITARCEMDLSPGIITSPRNFCAAVISIVNTSFFPEYF